MRNPLKEAPPPVKSLIEKFCIPVQKLKAASGNIDSKGNNVARNAIKNIGLWMNGWESKGVR